MELEQLKQNWDLLNQRLEANEAMTQELVKKMTCDRGKSAVDKLKSYDAAGVVVLSLCAVICGASYYFEQSGEGSWGNRLSLFVAITSVVSVLLFGTMLMVLQKIDFSESLHKNIHAANRYKVLFRIRDVFGLACVIPIFAMIGLYYSETNASLNAWIFATVWSLFCCTMGAIFVKKYLKRIRSMFDSLAELKALNEGKEQVR